MSRKREEHRQIIEAYLDRKLESGESVKRCDGNPENNKLSNLELVYKTPKDTKRKKHFKKVRIGNKTYQAHRVKIEEYLGRKLRTDEIVYHKDEDIHNNDINNLAITTWSQRNKQNPEKHAKYGSQVSSSKLTEEDIKNIRERIANKEPLALIAESYSVHKSTISKIKRGVNWPNP